MTYQIKQLTEDARDVLGCTSSMLHRRLVFFTSLDGGLYFKKVLVTVRVISTSSATGEFAESCRLLYIESRLFSNRLTSSPFCVAGSPVSESAEIDEMLDRKAIGLLDELDAYYIEYRDSSRDRDGWVKQSDLYATFMGEMEASCRPPTAADTSQTTSRCSQSAKHGSNDLDTR